MLFSKPDFISAAQVAAWNSKTSPRGAPDTGTFEVKKGQELVAVAAVENNGAGSGGSGLGVSGGSLTWAAQETFGSGGENQAGLRMWTAVVDADKSMSCSFSFSGFIRVFGGAVLLFDKSAGIGAHAQANNGTGSGAPLLELTTTQEKSAIAFIVVDWNAVTGARTYRTTDAGAATEVAQYADGAIYGVHVAYHASAGAAGKKQLGLTAPSGQRFVMAAVEVLGLEEVATRSRRGMTV